MDIKGGAAFVWTVFESVEDGILPFEITPRFRLAKTRESLVERQKDFLERDRRRFETRAITTATGTGSSTNFEPLHVSGFRYYSLEFDDPNGFQDVELVASFLPEPIIFSHHVYTSEGFGAGEWRGHGQQIHFPQAVEERFVPWAQLHLSGQLLGELKELLPLYLKSNQASDLVSNSTRLYRDLSNVPPGHALKLLGLVAILECILCHKPKVSENADSLGHQIQTKLSLLASRPGANIPKLPDLELKATWSRLYALRSLVAHGDTVRFPFKQLPFRDLREVVGFVDRTCRATIRQLLREVDLVVALREV